MGDKMARMAEFEPILDIASSGSDQELSLNIIWLLANISFYSIPGSRIFTSLYLGIDSEFSGEHYILFNMHSIIEIIPNMVSPNEEIVTESCRIIANLSRFPLPSPPKTTQRCKSGSKAMSNL